MLGHGSSPFDVVEFIVPVAIVVLLRRALRVFEPCLPYALRRSHNLLGRIAPRVSTLEDCISKGFVTTRLRAGVG